MPTIQIEVPAGLEKEIKSYLEKKVKDFVARKKIRLYEVDENSLPNTHKQALKETKNMKEEEFISF